MNRKLILKRPRFVTFGANLAKSGGQTGHPNPCLVG